ncbi:Phd finger protein 12 [Aphelenchoides fujianensis]|nr:Phd finger protein 12 [Aphelenchoides fujianensis]
MHTQVDFVEIAEGSPTEELELKCVDQNLIDPPNYELLPLKRPLRKKNDLKAALIDDVSERSASSSKRSCSADATPVDDEPPAKRLRAEIRKQQPPPQPKKAAKSDAPRPGSSKQKPKDANEDRCEYCRGLLICCDTCPAAFHPQCHTPELEAIPEGKFECYRCTWKAYYKENPVRFRTHEVEDGMEVPIEHPEAAHTSALLLEFIRTSKVVPYEVPDEIMALGPKIPSLLPFDKLERKSSKKKAEPTNDCYENHEQDRESLLSFCPNAVHFDCSPTPMCAAKVYAWRCPMHVENYLDTYFLNTNSTIDRVRLWEEFAQQPLNEEEVEREFVRRLAQESMASDEDQAAAGLRLLALGTRSNAPAAPIDQKPPEYTPVEMRMIPLNSQVLFNEVFRSPTSIAAFFPAFKTSTPPVVYDRQRALSFGTSDKCTFNLSQFGFNCCNMEEDAVGNVQQARSRLPTASELERLHERGREGLPDGARADLHESVRLHSPDRSRVRSDQVRSQVAVFPDRTYTVQMGCAVFYLVFNPALRDHE